MQFIFDIVQAILNITVNAVASFTAQVLNHPAVQNAAANAIVAGMKKLCHEPDLNDHVQALTDTLSKRIERDATQAGRDFPKLVGHFVKGMLSPPPQGSTSLKAAEAPELTSEKNDDKQVAADLDPSNDEAATLAKKDV